MDTTASRPDRRAPGFRDASANDLFLDLCRIGPAPTRSREIFVIAVTVVLVAAILAVLNVSWIGAAVAVAVIACFLGVRWAIGTRTAWAAR